MVTAQHAAAATAAAVLGQRIGIVTFDFYPSYGGQGRHTYDLWRHLRAQGVDVRVLSPSSNDLPGHDRTAPLSLRAGRSPAFSLAANLVLRRWQAENDIALLHLNGGPGGVLLFARPRAKVLYTAHHTYAQQARNVPGQSWKALLARVEGAAYRKADLVTSVSPSTARSLQDDLDVEPARTTVVPDGFDPSVFRPVEVDAVPQSVLYVGRLDARKGFQFLIEAWVQVARAMPSARLFVIGRGPLAAWAERTLYEDGVFGSVVFLGRQPEDELVAWYNRVSVVAVPSRFEGFGLTALEAIACGRRVVATNTEGLRDIVVDGTDGALVPFGDRDKFAWALLQHLQRRWSIGPSRLGEVAEAYAWPVVAARYVDVYRGLLAA